MTALNNVSSKGKAVFEAIIGARLPFLSDSFNVSHMRIICPSSGIVIFGHIVLPNLWRVPSSLLHTGWRFYLHSAKLPVSVALSVASANFSAITAFPQEEELRLTSKAGNNDSKLQEPYTTYNSSMTRRIRAISSRIEVLVIFERASRLSICPHRHRTHWISAPHAEITIRKIRNADSVFRI